MKRLGLVLDINNKQRMFVVNALRDLGFSCQGARTTAEADEILRSENVDFLVLNPFTDEQLNTSFV